MSRYKNTIANACGIGLLLLGTVPAACEGACAEPCCSSSLEIGGSYTHANLKVGEEPAFNGNLGGVQGIYEYKPWNSFYGALRVAWKQGNTENVDEQRKLAYIDAQQRVGYTYSACCDWAVTLFSGFGYRSLQHRLQPFDGPSVKFRYNEFYVPVGFLSEYFVDSCWSVGLNFTWMPQVFPTVEIVPLKGANWDLTKTMGNVLVELPIAYFFEEYKCCSLRLKPFYERWSDGRSTAATADGQSLGLPNNTYNFWGVELNFTFEF